MSKKPKPDVTLVSRIFAPEPAAASFRLEALVKALIAGGKKVNVLTTIPAPGTNRTAKASVENQPDSGNLLKVRRVQAKRDKTGYIRGYLSYISFDIPGFFRLLLAPAPRVYVVEPPPTSGSIVRMVATLKRRPYVYYAADVWSDAAASMQVSGLVVRVLRGVERFAMRGAACVLTVTPEFAGRAKALGARRVAVVQNGIDTDVFCDTGPEPQPLAGMTRQDVSESDWLVYAGTASEWQGAEVFVDAFAQVAPDFPAAKLLFLGQGSAWPTLQEHAARIAPGKVFFGKTDPGQAADWQRLARAALVSIREGVGNQDAYPTKVFAALACETPVIYAGPGPAAADIADNGLGAAVPWDTNAVATVMRELLTGQRQFVDLRKWVLDYHSLVTVGEKAATVVLSATRKAR